MPRADYSPTLAAAWTGALNRACAELPPEAAAALHLAGFEPVELDDYDAILALESDAAAAGYPHLNESLPAPARSSKIRAILRPVTGRYGDPDRSCGKTLAPPGRFCSASVS